MLLDYHPKLSSYLSYHSIALLAGRWPNWRHVRATICLIRPLRSTQLNPALLPTKVSSVVVIGVVGRIGAVGRRGGELLRLAVVRVSAAVLVLRVCPASSYPAGAVVRLVAPLATAAGANTRAGDEDQHEEDDYDGKDDPADPVSPGAVAADILVVVVVVAITSS